jgi:2,3-dihydroxybenzoate-AMP ligase
MSGTHPRIDVVGSADVPTWPQEIAAEYRARGFWTGQTFGDLLRERATAHPDREAVVGADERLTYAELDRRASALAGGLHWIGVQRGDRVVVQLPNEAVFVEVLFACFRLGAIPILALPAHRASELTHFASHSEAVAFITTDARSRCDHAALADEVRAAVPSVREVVIAGEPRPGQASLDTLRGATPLPDLATESGPFGRDLALLQLSGGTTGPSKLIPRTHDDYLYSVRASAEICEQDGDSRFLAVLPAGHNFTLSSAGILGTIESGGTVVMCPSPDPVTALALIETERITVTGLVPPLAIAWLEALPGSGRDVSSLQLLQVGGAKLDVEVARRVEPAFGCRLQQVFGMAEGLVNYTRPDDPFETVARTQGRPMSPADEVRVVDENDVDVAPGESGALLTRGPYTIRGYYRAAEHNATAFTADGFYRTGDLVRQSPTGHLEVVGRAKEQINRGGEKVAPAEVEGHLLAHPSVLDACVVGVPDAALGERTYAVVVPRGEQPTPASLRKFVRERGVAAFKVPDRITFLAEFPTTGVGKVSRRELRTLLAAELAETAATSAPATAPVGPSTAAASTPIVAPAAPTPRPSATTDDSGR